MILLPQVRDVGSGAFGVCKLMKNTATGELVAVKLMERGEKVGADCTGACNCASIASSCSPGRYRLSIGPCLLRNTAFGCCRSTSTWSGRC